VFVSSTELMATSPAGTGKVDVTVTTLGGTSATAVADKFDYATAPTVTGLSPSSGPAVGGTVVTITGTHFTKAATVSFGTVAGTGVVFVSSTELMATSPAGTGKVDVTVTTAGGTSATSASDKFSYL